MAITALPARACTKACTRAAWASTLIGWFQLARGGRQDDALVAVPAVESRSCAAVRPVDAPL
ncbi:hypothetical protein BFF78_08590 [Streptomyces fodineus]|uniref:Uncharacterized protein n=1 Tax=Streptomyces fodineus TaxID=1904616 RepID=A0A1D7Y685_9ACTN|nr:hypothetical protein BFF78_08590 [Streptomyces fodineus]